jgi:hypothetical protein
MPRDPHQNRLIVDAIEWKARLERLAGMSRFELEQSSPGQGDSLEQVQSVGSSLEVK